MSTVIDFPLAGTIGADLLPKRYDVTLYEGDTFEFTLVFKDKNGAAINATGWTAKSEIKIFSTGLPAQTTEFVMGYSDAATGQISVLLDYLPSETLGAGEYKYDIQITDNATPRVHRRTYIGGKITVTGDITE